MNADVQKRASDLIKTGEFDDRLQKGEDVNIVAKSAVAHILTAEDVEGYEVEEGYRGREAEEGGERFSPRDVYLDEAMETDAMQAIIHQLEARL